MSTDTKALKPQKRRHPVLQWWRRYGWPVARHLIIPFVCILVLFFGVAAGYTVLGGRPFSDIWEMETWRHMFDLIFAES